MNENNDECRYEGVGRAVVEPLVTTSVEASGGVFVTFAGGPGPAWRRYALRRSLNSLSWWLQWPGQLMATEFDIPLETPEQVMALQVLLNEAKREMVAAGTWPSNPDEIEMVKRVVGSLRSVVGNPLRSAECRVPSAEDGAGALDGVDDAGARGPELALAISPNGDAGLVASPVAGERSAHLRAVRPASFEEVGAT